MTAQQNRLSEPQVYDILKTVKYPGYSRDIVSFGMVKGIQVKEQDVSVTLQITTNQPDIATKLRQATEEALHTLPGVGTTTVEVRLKDQAPAGTPPNQNPFANAVALPGVQHTIAVASGKGGVGKSTVATNLAVALGMSGLRTPPVISDAREASRECGDHNVVPGILHYPLRLLLQPHRNPTAFPLRKQYRAPAPSSKG